MDDNDLPREGADFGEKVGRVAMSAVLATSLTAALSTPPNTDLCTLPEPTPIVQQYDPPVEEEALPAEDERVTFEESFWRKLLRVLKYLLVALLVVGSIALGVVKGCTRCAGPLATPVEDSQQDDQ